MACEDAFVLFHDQERILLVYQGFFLLWWAVAPGFYPLKRFCLRTAPWPMEREEPGDGRTNRCRFDRGSSGLPQAETSPCLPVAHPSDFVPEPTLNAMT